METGSLPSENIDHKNHRRNDNKFSNLRLANHGENSKNMEIYASNTSGVTGVYWNKREHKWHAQIRVSGKRIHLGFFVELDDAKAARQAANTQYGFHQNHGKRNN